MSVIARIDHPLAGVPLPEIGELGRYLWVVARKGTPNRAIFDRIAARFGANECASHGFVETGSLVTLRGVLMQSDHLTLLSPRQVEYELRSGLLCRIDFALEDTERIIGMTTRSDWHPTALQTEFVKALKRATAVSG